MNRSNLPMAPIDEINRMTTEIPTTWVVVVVSSKLACTDDFHFGRVACKSLGCLVSIDDGPHRTHIADVCLSRKRCAAVTRATSTKRFGR